ncbi:hypothetical protein T484DRAFT_1946556 [Baffinella frigidus]|nr:hypothetical protein T484DRAFT_1946556 [Cryptophyta sp. CCMP2293]
MRSWRSAAAISVIFFAIRGGRGPAAAAQTSRDQLLPAASRRSLPVGPGRQSLFLVRLLLSTQLSVSAQCTGQDGCCSWNNLA